MVSQSEWEDAANSQTRFGAAILLIVNLGTALYLTSPAARSAPAHKDED